MFCEGVKHYLRFCFDHLNCIKPVVFQLNYQLCSLNWDGVEISEEQNDPPWQAFDQFCNLVYAFLLSSMILTYT